METVISSLSFLEFPSGNELGNERSTSLDNHQTADLIGNAAFVLAATSTDNHLLSHFSDRQNSSSSEIYRLTSTQEFLSQTISQASHEFQTIHTTTNPQDFNQAIVDPFSSQKLASASGVQVASVTQNAMPTGVVLETRQIVVQGQVRTYNIYTPSSYNPNQPAPLLLGFHGGGGHGASFAESTGLAELAAQEGFILVTPDAVNNRWNDGRTSTSADVDDVGFVEALIQEVSSLRNISSQEIYATGHSNGGAFTQRLAVELSDQLTAVATVAGSLGVELAATVNPQAAIPVLMINSPTDPIVPWEGGELAGDDRGTILSIPEMVEFWQQHIQANAEALIEWLPDPNPNNSTRVQMSSYTNGLEGAEAILLTLMGGGHAWPGSSEDPNSDFDASQAIWDFFQNQGFDLTISDVSVTEGKDAQATFTVTLSAASTRTVTVDYATANGTAKSGSDYTAVSGRLTFAPGETSQTLTVPILDNSTIELDEMFSIVLTNAVNAIIADGVGLGTISDTITTATTMTLSEGIENLTLIGSGNIMGTGNTGRNTLTGNGGHNTLTGNQGHDALIGNNGNDDLVGGAGKDTLTGGGGNDNFIFNSKNEGMDTLVDFASSPDTLRVLASGFGGGLTVGTLASSQFVLGTKALDSGDRFIYDQKTGALFFDPDGSGSKAQTQIAALSNLANLNASDIVIF